jgi:hypothetical protein
MIAPEAEGLDLLEKYTLATPLSENLPAVHKEAEITLTKIVGQCKACGNNLEDQRGEIRHHTTCLEIESGGVCRPCLQVTWSRIRIYTDHILVQKDQGWTSIPRKGKTTWQKIRGFLKKALTNK